MQEPFDSFLPQGIVFSRTFKRSDSGKYVKEDDVVQTGKEILKALRYLVLVVLLFKNLLLFALRFSLTISKLDENFT